MLKLPKKPDAHDSDPDPIHYQAINPLKTTFVANIVAAAV